MEEQRRPIPKDAETYLAGVQKDWAKERAEARAQGTKVLVDESTGIKIEVDPEGVREDETEVI